MRKYTIAANRVETEGSLASQEISYSYSYEVALHRFINLVKDDQVKDVTLNVILKDSNKLPETDEYQFSGFIFNEVMKLYMNCTDPELREKYYHIVQPIIKGREARGKFGLVYHIHSSNTDLYEYNLEIAYLIFEREKKEGHFNVTLFEEYFTNSEDFIELNENNLIINKIA